jgi:hypothetical protein
MKLISLCKRVFNLFEARRIPRHWKDIERFPEAWSARIELMAAFAPPGSTVVDVGCGPMRLRRYLRDCTYIPLDYCDRGPGTIVCDLNKEPLPKLEVDCIFVSGCLEYLERPHAFIAQVATCCRLCIISYCATDHVSNVAFRARNAWVNHLSQQEVLESFRAAGMSLTSQAIHGDNGIFVFERLERLLDTPAILTMGKGASGAQIPLPGAEGLRSTPPRQ